MKNIGSVFRPYGLKGGVIFRGLENYSEEFLKENLKPKSVVYLFLLEKDEEKKRAVLRKVIFGKKIILYFQGYDDRTSLEGLLPFELKIEMDKEGLLEDLLGFTVLSQKSGEEVGKIISIGSNGSQKILEIRGKENFDIPWVSEFVEKIDKAEKKVFVNVPIYEQA